MSTTFRFTVPGRLTVTVAVGCVSPPRKKSEGSLAERFETSVVIRLASLRSTLPSTFHCSVRSSFFTLGLVVVPK